MDVDEIGFLYVLVNMCGTYFRWDSISRRVFIFLSGGRARRKISGSVFEFVGGRASVVDVVLGERPERGDCIQSK